MIEYSTVSATHKCGGNDNGKECGKPAFQYSFTGVSGPWVALCPMHVWVARFWKEGCTPLVRYPAPADVQGSALLKEVVDDVEAAGLWHVEEDWPDLHETYKKAKLFLAAYGPEVLA